MAAADARTPLQIRSQDGTVLGVIIATPGDRIEPAISDEELRRREADLGGKWYTAAEVEQKLKDWRCSK
jgi:hypothetical protein